MALYSRCKDCNAKIKYRTTRCNECESKRQKNIRNKDKEDEVRSIYQTSRWRKVREQVKIRDKGLCQLSLLENKIVPGDAVHHIERLTIGTLDMAFELDNLILLSKEKHEELHRFNIDTVKKFKDYVRSITPG